MSKLFLCALFEYLCYGSITFINSLLCQCRNRLCTSEPDVYRRQVLTYKIDPRAERVGYVSPRQCGDRLLTSRDVRFCRLKSVPALTGLAG